MYGSLKDHYMRKGGCNQLAAIKNRSHSGIVLNDRNGTKNVNICICDQL